MRLAIAFLFVVAWRCAGAYDYASACARPYRASRASRSRPEAPCDLSKYNYCTTPGNSYPWHAIRRFVRENQGLMKRMYGEERHISVLKAELENFIEDGAEEDEEDDNEKKSTEFAEDVIKTKLKYTERSHGRAMNRPHFRPINSDKNKKVDNYSLKVKPLITNQTKVNNTYRNKTEMVNNETLNEDKGISYKTKLESLANIEINNLDPDVITLDAVLKQSIETNSINYPNYSISKSEPITLDTKNTTIPDKNVTITTESMGTTEMPTTTEETSTDVSKDDWKPMTGDKGGDTSTLPPTLLFSEHEKMKNVDRMDVKVSDKNEEFHQKPQDVLKPSVIKLRGANACESKEEMAAPFWANSTRGEILALLNMYPFEQYIHLETCVHERKQMYCREGCRCEQQYRLHRLLAYDPRNECRGIFADWFKFPACCVCKCYDVPLEFRARSPRIVHPQYDDDVKRVIYEDVARDWYSSTYDEEEDDDDDDNLY